MALRRKGSKIATWEECYDTEASVILDNGKRYRLRREVTHAIHNAAKLAAYHLGKIWNQARSRKSLKSDSSLPKQPITRN
jgi:hypothetical protein